METYDTYCLVPEGAEMAKALDRLFRFDNVIYHDGVADHCIRSGGEAAATFSRLMRDGDFIRFHVSTVDRTQGGWLYRLMDGCPVIGLSGDVTVSGTVFRRALEEAVPGCQCCTIGDQPPPMTLVEFRRRVKADSRSQTGGVARRPFPRSGPASGESNQE
jgi:hypothetical protein